MLGTGIRRALVAINTSILLDGVIHLRIVQTVNNTL